MLEGLQRRFIDPASPLFVHVPLSFLRPAIQERYGTLLSTRGAQKIRFHYFSELVLLAITDLSQNLEDRLLLGTFLSHTSNFVTNIEDAASTGVLLFVQDHAAALLFTLGEFLHRVRFPPHLSLCVALNDTLLLLFRLVNRDTEGTIASWMTRSASGSRKSASGWLTLALHSLRRLRHRRRRPAGERPSHHRTLLPVRYPDDRHHALRTSNASLFASRRRYAGSYSSARPVPGQGIADLRFLAANPLHSQSHDLFPDLDGDWNLFQGMANTADAEYWRALAFPVARFLD